MTAPRQKWGSVVRRLPVGLTARSENALAFVKARMRAPKPHPALDVLTEGRVQEYSDSDAGALCLSVELVATLLGWQMPKEEPVDEDT